MKKLNSAFFQTYCVSLNLNFPGERKNTETDRFSGNGPYCKITTENQPIRMLHLTWQHKTVL